jgi:glutamate-5-semialdehyde dehydrogenase
MKLNGYVDVLIPRGGAGLIQNVVQNATVPAIETGVGNCHVYIDKAADLKKAIAIAVNAKVHRPSVCNAAETLLIHKDISTVEVKRVLDALKDKNVELRGCAKTLKLDSNIEKAVEADYSTEYLDLIMAVKIVDSLDEAIEHIHQYGSKHTEAIITENVSAANKFTMHVDASAVIVNASTRFTDGFEFGFGAEIGISTQKLHARGPMGLRALTTNKYYILGDGQVRG